MIDPDEEESAKEFLAELGIAVFAAQAMEYTLTTLFAVTATGQVPKPKISELMDERFSRTLGRLVRDAATALDLPDSLAENLQLALDARNWLIHHFYREYAPSAVDRDLRAKGLVRLRAARQLFETTSGMLMSESTSRLVARGSSVQDIEANAAAAVDRYVRTVEWPEDLWNDALRHTGWFEALQNRTPNPSSGNG
jgi:hypothetical protein